MFANLGRGVSVGHGRCYTEEVVNPRGKYL
jgi:hypothetical protein